MHTYCVNCDELQQEVKIGDADRGDLKHQVELEAISRTLLTMTMKGKLRWHCISEDEDVYASDVAAIRFVLSEPPMLIIAAGDDSVYIKGPDTNDLFDSVRAQVFCRDNEVLETLNRLG